MQAKQVRIIPEETMGILGTRPIKHRGLAKEGANP
jgi:hypothetical protein